MQNETAQTNSSSQEQINDVKKDTKEKITVNQNKNKEKKPYNKNRKYVDKNSAWIIDLKKVQVANERIHKNRLNPHNKLNLNTNAKVKITPLGGLDEIGGNMMIIETEQSAIVIDVGMSFPDNDMHGVDILIPDFTYLRSIKDKIKGIVITHGHEDHIGAMPYLFKEMQFPIYGTSLTFRNDWFKI